MYHCSNTALHLSYQQLRSARSYVRPLLRHQFSYLRDLSAKYDRCLGAAGVLALFWKGDLNFQRTGSVKSPKREVQVAELSQACFLASSFCLTVTSPCSLRSSPLHCRVLSSLAMLPLRLQCSQRLSSPVSFSTRRPHSLLHR